jgi:hypothetical protein
VCVCACVCACVRLRACMLCVSSVCVCCVFLQSLLPDEIKGQPTIISNVKTALREAGLRSRAELERMSRQDLEKCKVPTRHVCTSVKIAWQGSGIWSLRVSFANSLMNSTKDRNGGARAPFQPSHGPPCGTTPSLSLVDSTFAAVAEEGCGDIISETGMWPC